MPTPNTILLDSIAEIDTQAANKVVVSGSHGGASAGRFVLALAQPPCLVFFNDAGVGKDQAGLVALQLLDQAGVAAATYSHHSARIGDAQDGLDCGEISHVNATAALAGLRPLVSVRLAIERWTSDSAKSRR